MEGRFLSADWALLRTIWEDVETVRVMLGDGQRRGPDDDEGEGDLFLEREGDRVITSLFFSAGTNGCLGVAAAAAIVCFLNARTDSHTSIQTIEIRP